MRGKAKLWMPLKLFLFALVISVAEAKPSARPPLSPSWVFDHWVWEDDKNTEEALFQLLKGYRLNGIPVGAVILDSPWATEYNNFLFNRAQYPDPQRLIQKLHQQGVRVLLWVTAILNRKNHKGKFEPTTHRLYEEAQRLGFLLRGGATYSWWKGKGAFLDITQPAAIEWWHKLQDRVLDLGVDGYKVDEVALASFPSVVSGAHGKISKRKYMDWTYTDFYQHGLSKNREFAVMSRSVDKLPIPFAPMAQAPATWVGDQEHTFAGLREALSSILRAAQLGYAVVGSDTAGYHGKEPITKELLLRWAELSALTPLMENGGHGHHEPWFYDAETVKTYRFFVKLHMELKPYFYSLMVSQHQGEGKLIRPNLEERSYTLGESLFVAPIETSSGERTVHFPSGTWLDYWTKQIYRGGTTERLTYPLSRYPLFLKLGSIIPLAVQDEELEHGGRWSKGADTFWIILGGDSRFTLTRGGTKVRLVLNSAKERFLLTVEDTGKPKIFLIEPSPKPIQISGSQRYVQRAVGWASFPGDQSVYTYEPTAQRLWIKTAERGAIKLTVRFK